MIQRIQLPNQKQQHRDIYKKRKKERNLFFFFCYLTFFFKVLTNKLSFKSLSPFLLRPQEILIRFLNLNPNPFPLSPRCSAILCSLDEEKKKVKAVNRKF